MERSGKWKKKMAKHELFAILSDVSNDDLIKCSFLLFLFLFLFLLPLFLRLVYLDDSRRYSSRVYFLDQRSGIYGIHPVRKIDIKMVWI